MAVDDYGNPEPGDVPDPVDPTTPPPTANSGGVTREAIAAAYRQYLGRDPEAYEYQHWLGNPNFAQEIAGSHEAQQFQATGTVNPDAGAAPAGTVASKWNDPNHQSDKYVAMRIIARGGTPADVLRVLGPKGYKEIPGSPDKILGPDGSTVDLIQDEEGAHLPMFGVDDGTGHSWDKPRAANAVAGSVDTTGTGSWFEDNGLNYLGGSNDFDERTGTYRSTGTDQPPTGSGYTTLARPSWLTGPYVPGTFTAPTAEELYQDPGYKARLEASQLGFERGAAARGSILSGGSRIALGRRMQTEAANEYQNLYGRRFGEFGAREGLNFNARQLNENTYQTDVGNSLTQYQQRYKAYQDAINNQFRLQENGLTATLGGRP